MLEEIDFLETELASNSGLARTGNHFNLTVPWALAEFGQLRLREGWWRFDCQPFATSNAHETEVRLGSAVDQRIILSPRYGRQRVFLRGGSRYQVSLLISPWLGNRQFERLRLVRLSAIECSALAAESVRRVLRLPQPLARVRRALGRLASGAAIGITVQRDSVPAAHTPEHAECTEAETVEPRILEASVGGVSFLCDERDRFHPSAMDVVKSEFSRMPEARMLYCDRRENGVIRPKSQWDSEAAASWNFSGLPLFFRATDPILALEPGKRLASLQKFSSSQFGPIKRIPLPLVEGPRLRTIESWAPTPYLERLPAVSVVIPTKKQVALLERCLSGLANATGYSDLEVIIVDNGCSDPRFPEVLRKAAQELKLICLQDFGSFNFSRLVNAGVRRSTGEIVLLLNDDAEPIQAGWLHRMVESATRLDVGAVGARLLYPDLSVQHAGIAMGVGGICGHLWKGSSPKEAAMSPLITAPSTKSAVTGACLAVRRSAYDSVGGLDEHAFAVGFNDIDFCLRLHAAGLITIYRGDAVLIHHESKSRDLDGLSKETRQRNALETAEFIDRWWHFVEHDPWSSPAFDPSTQSGAAHPALANQPDYIRLQ